MLNYTDSLSSLTWAVFPGVVVRISDFSGSVDVILPIETVNASYHRSAASQFLGFCNALHHGRDNAGDMPESV